jgi:3-methyladenine DNA glycosylase AlkD
MIRKLSTDFPAGLSQPALRALAGAGYSRLDQLAKVSDAELRDLHGMGPKGIRILRAALKQKARPSAGSKSSISAPPVSLKAIRAALRRAASAEDAAHLQRFFKTARGEYGEGDKFIGIRVPVLRGIAREYGALSHDDVLTLLQSRIHEERLLALMLLVKTHSKGDEKIQKKILRAYLANAEFVNNWDLVDSSAEYIVGPHTSHEEPKQLSRLAHSPLLWERRIAIVSTFHHIRRREFDATLMVADWLLEDPHDLIHKAVGWMLREVGKRDLAVEEAFLLPRYKRMPRTMLRYAIERFPEKRRKAYLTGTAA